MAPSLRGSRWQQVVAAVLLGGLAVSCTPTAFRASPLQLQNRATYDLACPPYSLTMRQLDERTRMVMGCGRRLLYVEDCQAIRGRTACTWKLDTASFEQTQWPHTAAKPAPATVVIMPQPVASHAPPTDASEGVTAPPPPPVAGPAASLPPVAGSAASLPPVASSAAPAATSEPVPPPGRAQAGGREIPVDLFDSRR